MKKYTHEKAHEEVDRIFKVLLPQRSMAERPEQIRLCHSILDAMLDGGIALCDAGTGIGKTFAYLTAGILHGKCRAAEGRPQRPIWVLSLVMILTVYSRFFKLYMASAIAPIPLASFAGQPSSSIGVAFIKSYAAICLEGCMIVLACIIFSQFAAAPPAIADDTMAAATIVWNYIGELIFNMLVLVGAIKMSDRLVRELMGLG